jgi:hypothetical protein
MSLLRQMFGPNKEEIWRKLAAEVEGDFVDGGFWRADKVVVRTLEWTITLDTYTVSSGKHSTTFTRLRAPYVNQDGFRFTICRKSIFTGLGKFFGMQDIDTGDPVFDEAFVIQGTNPEKVRALFAHAQLRQLVELQPAIHLCVRDDEGWFGAEFPEGVDELHFQVVGVIKDIERLKNLFLLFGATLNYLCLIGSAYEHDPKVQL